MSLNKNKVWICSDWHFNHDREFIWKPRGFNSVYEMNQELINRHNAIVNYDDDVYCLGDCMLGNNDIGIKFIKQLNGKIHIIRGNHDTETRLELYRYCWNIVEVCDAKYLKYDGISFFLSHYPSLTSNYDENKPLKTRLVNLCGHVHTQNPYCDFDKGLIYHCEVDAHKCTPVSIDNIILEIKEKVKM